MTIGWVVLLSLSKVVSSNDCKVVVVVDAIVFEVVVGNSVVVVAASVDVSASELTFNWEISKKIKCIHCKLWSYA